MFCVRFYQRGQVHALIGLQYKYFQVPVRQTSWKYLHFVCSGTVYPFKALCCGLETTLQVFIQLFTHRVYACCNT